ncbi:putative nucleic acid-binding protein [Flavobacterium nitrogenifigens]|uniref:Nucleic acid-binding protein n=2 Tax=Flavobacterium TaxID=237 RepID=A0ABR6Q721_9FLAO|nr:MULTISPECIES: PIN domain-containing protein [Flavobacterium]MBB4801231.1 putative nucleic acid-binding protein [Flavobacterium nitrogenifigens]MBB6385021.1 putative nucleic acid-binding protein [Flavobacterium notoginsengisoli]
MNLFLDTNVLIDLIDKREPFYNDIAIIASLAENKKVKLATSSLSFVNTVYVVSRNVDEKIVLDALKKFRIICEVSNIDEIVIDKSLISNFNDFEDAVQYFSAVHHKSEIIITRNKKDFKNSEIVVMTPAEFLATI